MTGPERIFRVQKVGRNYHVCEGREAAPGVAAWVGGQDSSRAKEAAYLFAAAPELLAALRTACDSLHENGGIWEDCTDSDLCPGCAAIAKAQKGRQ